VVFKDEHDNKAGFDEDEKLTGLMDFFEVASCQGLYVSTTTIDIQLFIYN
jgi:hypothetical protein